MHHVSRAEEFKAVLEERAESESRVDSFTSPLVRAEDRAFMARFVRPPTGPRMADPLTYYRLRPGRSKRFEFEEHPDGFFLLATNSSGLRNDAEVMESPDRRVLIVGDSHTQGLCNNAETFSAHLQAALRDRLGRPVEVLNAGVSSYNHFHYLGALEKYGAELAPDLFVVMAFGGNDFSGALQFHRFYSRKKPARKKPHDPDSIEFGPEGGRGFLGQEIHQLCHLLNNPAEVEEMKLLNVAVSRELKQIAAASGSELLVVYLPPASRGQPERYSAQISAVAGELGVDAARLAVSDELADHWLEHLRSEEVACLDLRPAFRAAEQPLYWQTDGHLGLRGHELVARELLDPTGSLVR